MRPRNPLLRAVTPADDVLDAMPRAELIALLNTVPTSSPGAMARATDDALRDAARTYLRIGRLTAAQVLQSTEEAKV